ncbi:MAG: family 20 glycosylhydrolase [Clostridia bacterium]|nr:family 20 glycosylhydrolase [Clostridia bacterium]
MFDVKKNLIPFPQKISDSKKDILIGKMSKADFDFQNNAVGDIAQEAENVFWEKMTEKAAINKFNSKSTYKIKLDINPQEIELGKKKDSYKIKITSDEAALTGYDEGGLYYAVVTFLSLVHTDGEDVLIPEIEIDDYPDFKTRSQFMECRWGSDFMTLDDWKHAIDYFSKMKINKLTIGVYGCWGKNYDDMTAEYLYIPFKSHPELKTPRHIKYYSAKNKKWVIRENVLPPMFEQDFFGELVKYGKKKNVMISPLFNSLGHNTLLPRLYPETAAIDENGNPKIASFCTNNPATYKLMFELYDEIIDRYLTPNGVDEIAIGLDEVCLTPEIKLGANCHCEKCQGKVFTEDLIVYTIKLCKYLISKGMKSIYVYFDMFFLYDINILDETLKQRFIDEGIYDYIVFDWWHYESIDKNLFNKKPHLVNNIFRSIIKPCTGYYHWSIAADRTDNIIKLSKMAHNLGMEGIEPYGAFDECFDKQFKCSADFSWNAECANDIDFFNERYAEVTFPDNKDEAVAILNIMRELMCADECEHFCASVLGFQLEYYGGHSGWGPALKNFPGAQFERMLNNESDYFPYLHQLREKADTAYKWFESCTPSHLVDVWKLIAMHHYVLIDTYCTFIDVYKKYNCNEIDEHMVLREVSKLFADWERLIKFAEDVRIAANTFIYIRNMSIFREFILNMKVYLEKEIKSGRKPVFEIKDMDYVKSELYYYIR